MGDGEHVPSRACQRGDDHAGVPAGPKAQPGQRGDPEPGCHEGLNGQVVVGGEGDPWREARRLAQADKVVAAPLAAGDPAAARVCREARDRHRVALHPGSFAGRRGGDQVHRLVEQQHAAGAFIGRLRRRLAGAFAVVPEHHRNVDVTGVQHPQRLRRLGFGQHELEAGCLGRKAGRGCRDKRGERGREGG
jgi:hypothetical protein